MIASWYGPWRPEHGDPGQATMVFPPPNTGAVMLSGSSTVKNSGANDALCGVVFRIHDDTGAVVAQGESVVMVPAGGMGTVPGVCISCSTDQARQYRVTVTPGTGPAELDGTHFGVAIDEIQEFD